jgi:hypothetical protein
MDRGVSLLQGDITVSNNYKAAYAARFINISSGTGINDLFFIAGSATKTIRILRISLSSTQNTTNSTIEVQLLKRSTADTGGTPPNQIASYSSNNPVQTATLAQTPAGMGSLVGIIRSTKMHIPITGVTGAAQNEYTWYFNHPSQALVLRGTGDCVAVNFVGTTVTGGSFNGWIEWTEE